jgi:hypothetical protein
MQKVKEQSKKISEGIQSVLSYNSSLTERRHEEKEITKQTMELARFNQKRRNYPAVMMGLMSLPKETS